MASSTLEPKQSGFLASSTYDLHRPSYPTKAVQALLQALSVDGVENARLLDLAAGTGKFTELLARRAEAYEVLAVEPHDSMRAELTRKELPRVKVINGAAEKMAVESQWADAIIIAQVRFC